jgi:hypothetical protein
MMNLGMGLGDDVIFSVPGLRVFVDSRLESYPPDFLRAVLAAQGDDGELDRLLDRHGVQWLFTDHTRPTLRARALHLLAAGWRAVYVDSTYLVIVRPTPATTAYVQAHAIDLRRAQPADLVDQPSLRKQQQENFAAFIAALPRQPTDASAD